MSYLYRALYEFSITFGHDRFVRVLYRKSNTRNFTDLGIVCGYIRNIDGFELIGRPIFDGEVAQACNMRDARSRVLDQVCKHYGLDEAVPAAPDLGEADWTLYSTAREDHQCPRFVPARRNYSGMRRHEDTVGTNLHFHYELHLVAEKHKPKSGQTPTIHHGQ